MAYGMVITAEKIFVWNIDAHVGPGCPNRPEDVQLVQLGYYWMARNPKKAMTPQRKAAYSAVVPGSKYTGLPGDPLSVAIKVHQQERGGTQDGKVSPVQPSGAYGEHIYMLVSLSNNIKYTNFNVWPLLHKVPNCPAALAAASRRTFD